MRPTQACPARRRGSALAEFGPVLWLFLILILLPMFDFISFCTGVGTVQMMSTMGAQQCAGAVTFGDAQQAASNVEQQLQGFLKFAKASPAGGAASGIQVQVLVTPAGSGGGVSAQGPFSTWGNIPNGDPNRADASTYNQSTCIYQYLVTTSYDVLPLFNFGNSPFFNNVPGLGQPVKITYTTTCSVEHPEGLNQGPSGGGSFSSGS